jgi:hypothetical protein
MAPHKGKKQRVSPATRILDDPNKEIHKTYGLPGLLSKLWRRILYDRKITGYRYGVLMSMYLESQKSPDNPAEENQNRGNLNRQLTDPKMSWKTLCKAFRFIRAKRIRFIVEIDYEDDTTMVHRVQADLSGNDDDLGPDGDGDDNKPISPLPDDQDTHPFLDDRE